MPFAHSARNLLPRMRLVELDGPHSFSSSGRELPNRAIQFLEHEPGLGHSVQEILPCHFSRSICRRSIVEQGAEDFVSALVDGKSLSLRGGAWAICDRLVPDLFIFAAGSS
jgi:hypothetical protein